MPSRGHEDGWVVVGSGASGAVVAARATERSNVAVLLLEAGSDYQPGTLPKDLRNGGRNSYFRHDWGYKHEPTSGQKLPFMFPRGRVVGGSSAVNTCIAIRGRPYDYDEWGLPEWTWDQCLPAFKRLETDLDIDDEWHGQEGPILIRRHTREELMPWQAAFLDSCAESGVPYCPDHNNPLLGGAGPHAMNKVGGERIGAARGYLTRQVRARDNLALSPDTLVRRILFDGRKVRGLEVEKAGRVEVIPAKRVLLAGGAINTPGILLRSGIGPKDVVARLGVDLVADVPAVGARLLDHPGAAIFFLPKFGIVGWDDPLIQCAWRFTSDGSPYYNDTQIQAGSLLPFPWITIPLVSIMVQVGKPRGHGTLTFESADPHHKPTIRSHVFEDHDDRERGIEGLRRAYEVAQKGPMAELGTLLWPRPKTLMGSQAHEWIRKSCDSGYHPCGTVPMGKDGDPKVACDAHGRVRGVDGLWVVDASLFPTVPVANTHLTALMFGERFGEWVREGVLG